MKISVREALSETANRQYGENAPAVLSYLPEFPIDADAIRAILINEIVANAPEDDFYSRSEDPYYMQSTIPLLRKGGADVRTIDDILNMGIYITNAVKLPKRETTIPKEVIQRDIPLLRAELELFPNAAAIMLMGDVAKKAYNIIAKAQTGKNAVPSGSTCRLRANEYYAGSIRVFPAYIMTGKNILIEKSKVEMSAEDIGKMLAVIAR